MSDNSLFSLMRTEELGIEQKIVEELLNNKNLETKTEIHNPTLFSSTKILEQFLINKQMMKSGLIVGVYVEYTFKYLISLNRKGRLEYLESLKGLKARIPDSNPLSMNK